MHGAGGDGCGEEVDEATEVAVGNLMVDGCDIALDTVVENDSPGCLCPNTNGMQRYSISFDTNAWTIFLVGLRRYPC